MGAHGEAAGAGRPGWLSALMILGAVLVIVIGGRYLMRPIFRYLAASQLREVLTAAALLIVLAVALLMEAVGLSPALGTFLAGVLLAESEYRHQLETDIEPFKGLLLGVFFIAVGASIDFGLLAKQPGLLTGATALVIVLKALVLLGLGRAFGLERRARYVLTFGLAQIGEFAFVLASFGQQSGVLPPELAGSVVVVVAMSMLIAPLLRLVLDRVVLPRLEPAAEARAPDAIESGSGHVVMAGFGRMGQIAGRMLRQTGVEVTVLDLDPEIIDVIRRIGSDVYYGDASRLDLLHSAGCERAQAFVVCIDDADKTLEIVKLVQEHYPKLPIIARASDRVQFYKLRQMGIEHVVRETYESALTMGELTLRVLGRRAHEAHRAAAYFRHYEVRASERLAMLWGKVERTAFFTEVRDALGQTEELMRQDLGRKQDGERGWDNETLRADLEADGKVD
jgi:glutathione-regulated potassium-efflux system ancillary protein KefC